MNLLVREVLIEIARDKKNQIVGYQELSDICDLGLNMIDNPRDRLEIGAMLGEISEYEHNYGRPLLSSLVLRISDGDEGAGFYRLAEALGYCDFKKLKKELFAYQEINKCIEFWTNEDNYNKYFNI